MPSLDLPPRLETARLVLRRWVQEDAPTLRTAVDASDAHLRPWLPWMKGEPRTLAQTAERLAGTIASFDRRETFCWAVFAQDVLVGEVMLMTRAGPGALELGYWLHADHLGRGYAAEAVSALVRLADGGGVARLEAWCALGNHGSNRLVQRLGFHAERVAADGGLDYRVWVRSGPVVRPPVVIPCAGLGSRLGPLTRDCPKELLPLGGRPALLGTVLELRAAGISDAVVVTSAKKPGIAAFLAEHAPWVGLVEQPEPSGVFDAVERARAELGADRLAVLFPDYVALPDQRALAQVLDRASALPPEATVYGLIDRTEDCVVGPTASVVAGPAGAAVALQGVGARRDRGLHTAMVELRGTEHTRRLDGDDTGLMDLLGGLAADGLLHGVPLAGGLLDIGTPAGHADALARFEDGRARWRDAEPT